MKTCGACEYFDRHHGDCLNPNSDRFQTEADREACPAFHPDSTAQWAQEFRDRMNGVHP